MGGGINCGNCGSVVVEGKEHLHCCISVMKVSINVLKADNALLTYKVEELQSLCMEFASIGRTTVNQNDALRDLCESYSDISNRRHLK